jgi:nucleoside-diphosphate-sugar epimerase
MSLKGKTIFITGASRGIGLAIAMRAARDGANIAIVAKTERDHPKRFNDGTRVSRPLPGTPYPPDIERVMMCRRYRVLNRALAMEGWPKEVVKELESVAGETARKVTANYRGWRRPGLLTVSVH